MLTRNDETNRQQREGHPEVIATRLNFGRLERRYGAEICSAALALVRPNDGAFALAAP